MFKAITFDNSRSLTKYINENNISKNDIVNIIQNNESNYVLFYYS